MTNNTQEQILSNALNPSRSVYSVLGNLCKETTILHDPEIALQEKDFAQDFHKIVFSAIYNLTFSNFEASSLNEIDIDNYLASYPKLYKIWEKHDGLTYVRDSIAHANRKTFSSNYDRLKKFSLLRMYVKNGIDVSDLYDYMATDLKVRDDSMKNIDKMTVNQIIEFFTLKMIQIRDDYNTGQEKKDFKAGDDLDSLLDKLNQEPEFGYPFKNSLYNTIFRGMRVQKFMLRSAGTGTGKTRQAIADMCNASFDEIYDYEKGWISNGPSLPALFISTELEKEELQTTMLAFVTGVDEGVIKDGNYSPQVLKRLKYGLEIIKRAPLYCVYVDDFSISDIEMIIERYLIEEKVSFVAFDYIQMTPKLSRSMATAFGSNLREDQILVQFSAALKILANKYGIFLESSTQLNRNANEHENRDTTSLRGGKLVA